MMIAYCGLVCTDCPVYLATRSDSDREREKVAADWKAHFGWNLTPSDIDCEGCLRDGGRLFKFCGECGVRACAREKGLDTCGRCSDYVCDKLQGIIDLDPSIKTRLEEIRVRAEE